MSDRLAGTASTCVVYEMVIEYSTRRFVFVWARWPQSKNSFHAFVQSVSLVKRSAKRAAYELSAMNGCDNALVTRGQRFALDDRQRVELETLVARADAKPSHVRRAKVVLLAAQGLRNNEIADRLSLSVGQVSRIRHRFQEASLEGLADKPRGGRKDHAVPIEKKRLVLSIAESTPPVGRSRWTTRLIGARVGLCSATVAKVLRTARPGEERRSDAE